MKPITMKVLLYLKKSHLDKNGQAPIMGRITYERSQVQFSCKLSCTPSLWNPREHRLSGKSQEAMRINARLEQLLLSIHSTYQKLQERGLPIETVSHMLGHSDIQATERYAQVTPSKLFDEFARFTDFTQDLSLALNPA